MDLQRERERERESIQIERERERATGLRGPGYLQVKEVPVIYRLKRSR